MNPCEQKDNIEDLYRMANANKDKLHAIEVRQAQIAGDVSHIRSRIENGMSATIASMNEKLTILIPKIEHHASIVRRVEDVGWWISKSVLVVFILSILGMFVWAIANGWKP